MNPWATLGTVNGCWAWFPWQDLVAVGTLEHFCHAPTVTGPAWMASTGQAESTSIFMLTFQGLQNVQRS